MNIIFAGTPEFAATALQALVQRGHRPSAVYTQPDRPAGRGKKLLPSAVKQVAEKAGIAIYQPERLTDPAAIETLRALAPDVMIVAAYGLLLPKAVLDIPRLGCINIHASLLPRWRGAAPIQRAIQAGDTETGITIMQMDVGLDTGHMLLKKSLPITADDTGGSLHDKLAELGAQCLLAYLDQAETIGTGETQNDDQSSYARKLTKQEAEIDWSQSAETISLMIRAFNPWPVAYTHCGEQTVRIYQADVLPDITQKAAGTIIKKSREGLDIACGNGCLRVRQLQLPGGKILSANDFYNGNHPLLNEGEHLSASSTATH